MGWWAVTRNCHEENFENSTAPACGAAHCASHPAHGVAHCASHPASPVNRARPPQPPTYLQRSRRSITNYLPELRLCFQVATPTVRPETSGPPGLHIATPASHLQSFIPPCLHVATRVASSRAPHLDDSTSAPLQHAFNAPYLHVCTPAACV